jgi:hypothetical protein
MDEVSTLHRLRLTRGRASPIASPRNTLRNNAGMLEGTEPYSAIDHFRRSSC